jgi:hypothetical protein
MNLNTNILFCLGSRASKANKNPKKTISKKENSMQGMDILSLSLSLSLSFLTS